VEIRDSDCLLITGATGLVGSHVAEAAQARGIRTRALVRAESDTQLLESLGVERCVGDMTDGEAVRAAVADATLIVHCAAKVGDWGPTEAYRSVNVRGVEHMLAAVRESGQLRRYIHISSLGVYPARDHYGTDESVEPHTRGIDGYTLTKIESEQIVRAHVREHGLPAVILRPGFIYGPRDRTVLPRIFEKLKTQKFAFLGSKDTLMNNTFVDNLCEAVFLGLTDDNAVGKVFNIRDDRLVTKGEFINTIARCAGYPEPKKVVPLPVARGLASVLEGLWKLLGKQEAPILSSARIKFLGLNLDYSIDRAKRELGYTGAVDFQDGMRATVDWFRAQGQLP
jgi:nucleoside-diphosphate-sugar epimerase